MEDNDDPYTILGVPKTASQQSIKAAYRKLALRFHPDKQSTDEDRKVATVQFAKLSNAYEILGDEQQRRQYDLESSSGRPGSKMPRTSSNPSDSFHHPFDHHHHHPFHANNFHDPFSVFESFFRDEFGSAGGDFYGNPERTRSATMRNPSVFDDPFFGGGSGFGGGSLFGNDPFFGGNGMMMGGGGLFGAMNQHMNGMVNMHQTMMRQQQHEPPNYNDNNHHQSYVYTSTSSNIMGGGGGGGPGESIRQSTTTRIVNGKRQVVKEHVVQRADGTVERHVDLSGDDDFPGGNDPRSLLEGTTNNRGTRHDRQALGWQEPPQRRPSRTPENGSKTQQKDSETKARGVRSLFSKRKRRDSSKTNSDQP